MKIYHESMPWWGERNFYPIEGKIESVTKIRSFMHWLWFKEVFKTTISLSYPENIDTFKNINGYEVKPPQRINIVSNNVFSEIGQTLNLMLGYASPLEQFHLGVYPFIFKFEDGTIIWK